MSEHKGSTDAVTKVTLPSAIDRARWLIANVGIGEMATFEVATRFVGDGAPIKVEVRTKSGKTLGSVSGKIGVNRFQEALKVPDGTTEDIYFEAELSKHGLKGRSGLLKLMPRRGVRNATWDPAEARRGDVVKLAADTSGIPEGAKVHVSIFEKDPGGAHDLVAEFDPIVKGNKIEAQWEYDYHDATKEIPAKDESEKGYVPPEYFFRAQSGDSTAESGLLRFKDWISIEIRDGSGKPYKDEEYVLHLPDGSQRKGKLGADGTARVEDIPAGPIKVEFPRLKGSSK